MSAKIKQNAIDIRSKLAELSGGTWLEKWFRHDTADYGDKLEIAERIAIDNASGDVAIGENGDHVQIASRSDGVVVDNTNIGSAYPVGNAAHIRRDTSSGDLHLYASSDTAGRRLHLGHLASDGSDLMIDAAGNVGIGVTPESWPSHTALQLGGLSSLWAESTRTAGKAQGWACNVHYDGGYKYMVADQASEYKQVDGGHEFRVAPAGSEGGAISWNTALKIANDGTVGVGTNPDDWSDHSALQFSGGGAVSGGTSDGSTNLLNNAYHNGGWKRVANGSATRLDMNDEIVFSTAGSGVPHSSIAWSPALTIDNGGNASFSGDVTISSTSPTLVLNDTDTGADCAVDGTGANGQLVLKADYNNERSDSYIGFEVDGGEKVRINASGDLLLGIDFSYGNLTVYDDSTGDGEHIAAFFGSRGVNGGLKVTNYGCGIDNDRVGLYFQNEGVANVRMWVDDTQDLRVSSSNPTGDTSGVVVGTQTFTGTHLYRGAESDLQLGEAVKLVDRRVVRTTTPGDPACIGIYAGVSERPVSSFGEACTAEDPAHAVIGLGDTRFNQSDVESTGLLVDCAVAPGDLLRTSDVPGRLTKQADDLMRASTVAKAMEAGDASAPVYAYVYSG